MNPTNTFSHVTASTVRRSARVDIVFQQRRFGIPIDTVAVTRIFDRGDSTTVVAAKLRELADEVDGK